MHDSMMKIVIELRTKSENTRRTWWNCQHADIRKQKIRIHVIDLFILIHGEGTRAICSPVMMILRTSDNKLTCHIFTNVPR